jgi:hypothetical protein
MRYAFFLLGLIVGTVLGDDIDARITGVTADEHSCSLPVLDALYDECVVDTAVALGASFARRLELRGSRDLQSCSICPPPPYPRGHWCYVKCNQGTRRLTLASEHPDRRLVNQGQIQGAARTCYQQKAAMPYYQCLGIADDIKVKVSFKRTNDD